MVNLEKLNIHTLALDGLDGSGKGSCAQKIGELVAQKGDDVIIVELPKYDTPWGKVLRKLLSENDEGLTLEERMTVYALNRLEITPSLQDQITQHPGVQIIFDRFVTSNALTLAYYLSKKQNVTHAELAQQTMHAFSRMFEIDTFFLHMLNLQETKVYVPMLEPEIALQSVDKDVSRKGRDLYETSEVQTYANSIYKVMAELSPYRIKLIPQIISDDGHMRRLTQDELSKTILYNDRSELANKKNQLTSSSIQNLEITSNLILETEMNLLLSNKYVTNNLRRINPYN